MDHFELKKNIILYQKIYEESDNHIKNMALHLKKYQNDPQQFYLKFNYFTLIIFGFGGKNYI